MFWAARRPEIAARAASIGGRRTTKCIFGAAVIGLSLFGLTAPAMAATSQILTVSVVGPGVVTSSPPGISCPAKCKATFTTGTRVILTRKIIGGSSFEHWGGSCSGTGTCTVTMGSLAAVAAEFKAGAVHPQPIKTDNRTVAVPGSYTGNYAGEYGSLTFFVSPGGTKILNISVPYVNMACAPSGSFPTSTPLSILSAGIAANGTLTAAGTQQGVFSGGLAKFSYSVTGRFKGATTAGPATATGTLSESVAFTSSGAAERCTSNSRSWTVSHDAEAAPQNSSAVAGSYSGSYPGEYGQLAFFVLPGGRSLVNISVPYLNMACTPTGSFPTSNPLSIPQAQIKPSGSFVASGVEKAVFSGEPATLAYTFAGNVEGATPSGPVTIAGTVREEVKFSSSGANEICTSNENLWTATHDPQPVPTNSLAKAGNYTGEYPGEYGTLKFSVTPGGKALADVSVPYLSMACTPTGSFPTSNPLTIAQVAITPDGSFSAAATQPGVFNDLSAKFTYLLEGYVEGATPTGAATIAGIIREDITFTASGASVVCSSDDRSWAAALGQ